MRPTVTGPLWPSWARVRARLWPHMSDGGDPAEVVHELFFRFLVATSLLCTPLLATSEAPASWKLSGAGALTVALLLWLRGRRRGCFPWWSLPLEAAALLVYLVALGNPPIGLGVVYMALYFRSFYGSAASAVALWAAWIAVVFGALFVAGGQPFAPADVPELSSPSMLTLAPGFAMTIVIMRVLVTVAASRSEDERRQRVLTWVGVRLSGARSVDKVQQIACAGARELANPDGAVAAVLARRRGDAWQVGGACGAPPAITRLPLSAPEEGRPAPQVAIACDCDVDCTVVGLTVGQAWWGAVHVATSEAGLRPKLEALATLTELALERIAAANRTSAREARFRSLVANSADVIRVADADGIVRYESDAVTAILGYDPDEVIGRPGLELVHPDDAARLAAVMEELKDSPGSTMRGLEVRMRHADGSWRFTEGTARNLLDDPAVGGVAINYRDVTERKQLERELHHRALHDPLTELPNRALFRERVARALRIARGTDAEVTVLFVDVDDFKTVNDGLGHEAGDEVLQSVAARLRAVVRPTDTCARLGGDEFGVLLTDLPGSTTACDVADRLIEALSTPVAFDGGRIDIDVSIGVACRRSADTAEELIRNADLAMYRAKRNGKGTRYSYEPGMDAEVRDRVTLRSDIERGLAAGEFEPFYQPLVLVGREDMVGVEALVRWRHPGRGVLPPGAFLEVAEDTGLVVPMGRRLISRACHEVAGWSGYTGQLNVNLSVPELARPDLPDFLAGTLDESGLRPERLVVEVTESMFMDDPETAVTTLRRLRALGVRIALDDFGTGWSSLSFLDRFPVDVVKIDRSFVDGLGRRDESPLTGAIITLCRSLQLEVTAEGVEDRVQAERLHQLGCRTAQGYLWSPPVDGTTLARWLQPKALVV